MVCLHNRARHGDNCIFQPWRSCYRRVRASIAWVTRSRWRTAAWCHRYSMREGFTSTCGRSPRFWGSTVIWSTIPPSPRLTPTTSPTVRPRRPSSKRGRPLFSSSNLWKKRERVVWHIACGFIVTKGERFSFAHSSRFYVRLKLHTPNCLLILYINLQRTTVLLINQISYI